MKEMNENETENINNNKNVDDSCHEWYREPALAHGLHLLSKR